MTWYSCHRRSLPCCLCTDDNSNSRQLNILAYIAGYIIRKVKVRLCEGCVDLITGQMDINNEAHQFLAHKLYDGAKTGLLTPSETFLHVLDWLEAQFNQFIAHTVHMDSVRERLVLRLSKLPEHFGFSCPNMASPCKLLDVTLQLFITIRLHHTLKCNNRDFAQANKARRNRKTLKFSHM